MYTLKIEHFFKKPLQLHHISDSATTWLSCQLLTPTGTRGCIIVGDVKQLVDNGFRSVKIDGCGMHNDVDKVGAWFVHIVYT